MGAATEHAGLVACAWCPTNSPRWESKANSDREGEGLFDRMNGVGAHEVIIETPDHAHAGDDAGKARRRGAVGLSRSHARPEERPPLPLHPAFQESRRAGGRIARTHALAIDRPCPSCPSACAKKWIAAKHYYDEKERCIFCDMIRQEIDTGVARDSGERLFHCARALRAAFPFETWILPRQHSSAFENMPTPYYGSLARVLHDFLARLDSVLSISVVQLRRSTPRPSARKSTTITTGTSK